MKHQGTTWPMFQASNIARTSKNLLQIVPIPAYIVYDRLDHELDAIVVLERIKASSEHDLPYLKHCNHLLWAAMVKYRNNDANIAPPAGTFVNMPPPTARSWVAQKINPPLGPVMALPTPQVQRTPEQAQPQNIPTKEESPEE
eukprot:5118498-Ditylum_brightwellii.AAC.1